MKGDQSASVPCRRKHGTAGALTLFCLWAFHPACGALTFSEARRLGATEGAGPSFVTCPNSGPGESFLFYEQGSKVFAASSQGSFWAPRALQTTGPGKPGLLSASPTAGEAGFLLCWGERGNDGVPAVWCILSPRSQTFEPFLFEEEAFWPFVLSADERTVLWHRMEGNRVAIYEERLGQTPQLVAEGYVLSARSTPDGNAAVLAVRQDTIVFLAKQDGLWSSALPVSPARGVIQASLALSPEGQYVGAVTEGSVVAVYRLGDQVQLVDLLWPAPVSFAFSEGPQGPLLFSTDGSGVIEVRAVLPHGLGEARTAVSIPEKIEALSASFDTDSYVHLIVRGETALWYSTTCPAPRVSFDLTPAVGEPPLAVQFTSRTEGVVRSLHWDFGDGSQSHLSDPTHVYYGAGAYTVTLTAVGPGGTATQTRPKAVLVQSPGTTLRLPQLIVEPGATVAHPVLVRFITPLRGYQVALAFPGNALREDPEIIFDNTPTLRMEPEFVGIRLESYGEERALFVGVIFDWNPPFDGRVMEVPPAGAEVPLFYLRYSVALGAGSSYQLRFTNSLGDPPMRNILTSIETKTLIPLLESGGGTVVHSAEERFLRGDANADGQVDMADAIAILAFLFAGGFPPQPCLDAGDANDSGAVDLADAIALLSFLFSQAPPPAYPFPEAGIDPTEDQLLCTRKSQQ